MSQRKWTWNSQRNSNALKTEGILSWILNIGEDKDKTFPGKVEEDSLGVGGEEGSEGKGPGVGALSREGILLFPGRGEHFPTPLETCELPALWSDGNTWLSK